MKIDFDKLLDKTGRIDQEKLDKLVKDKPIMREVSAKKRMGFSVKQNRDRMVEFPDRLPTAGMMPLPIDEHEHIGNYETNHNLYLTIAHAYNKLMERVEELENK